MKHINIIFKRFLLILFILCVGFILEGCNFNQNQAPNEENPPQINRPTSLPTITCNPKEITVKIGDIVNLSNGVSAIGYYNDDLTSDIEIIHQIPINDNKYSESGRYEVTYHLIIKSQVAAIETRIVTVESEVEIEVDNIKPVIDVIGKVTYTVGDEINFLNCVLVTDNKDENPTISIVESESNLPLLNNNKLNEIGSFKIVYKAIDKSGNETKATYEFTVNDISSLGENLIKNADFENTTTEPQGFGGWLVLADKSTLKLDYNIENEKVILTVNNYTATENWHNQFKQTNLKIERGQHYTLKITLSSSIQRDVMIGVQNDQTWEFHLNKQVTINSTPQEFSFDFYGTSNNANVIFFVGLGKVNGVSPSDHLVSISGLGLYKTKANTNVNVSIPEGYKLVWSDEFDGNGQVDTTKWTHEIGGHGWGNNELQYYTNSQKNSYQKDGLLHIVAIKENYGGRNYTSARLITKNLAEFKYGIVEAKIQLPSGGGVWPAFWMLGSNINSVSWPNCGEIDIMEGRGNIPDVILGTIHCGAYNHSIGTQKGSELFVPNSETTYNLYRLEWTEEKIVISVNGNEYFKFEKPTNATFAQWPFSENFYIILNVAMGGMFGGSVDPNFTEAEMLVDYVRVYQKN